MTNENYAVIDFEKKEFLSKICITLEEAYKFHELCPNKEGIKIAHFGWHPIKVTDE